MNTTTKSLQSHQHATGCIPGGTEIGSIATLSGQPAQQSSGRTDSLNQFITSRGSARVIIQTVSLNGHSGTSNMVTCTRMSATSGRGDFHAGTTLLVSGLE